MNIKYWQGFSKRKNSTKQPSGTGTDLTVVMKDNTSREHPTFILSGYDWSMNYIQAFGDYYYVEDIITNTNGTSEVVCSIDPMATAKAEIGATSAFVLYSTQGGNTKLVDPRLPKQAEVIYAEKTTALPWTTTSAGSFRIVCTGDNGIELLSFPVMGLAAFLSSVASWSDSVFNAYTPPSVQGDTIEQIKESIEWLGDLIGSFFKQQISYGNAGDNIRSCRWVPFPSEGTTGSPVFLGQHNTGYTNAGFIGDITEVRSVSLSIPWPGTITGWRRSTIQMYIYLPFVGVIQVPTTDILGQSTLTVTISRDRMTGTLAYQLDAGVVRIGTYGGESGCDFPIGAATGNISGVVNSIISVGAGIAAGGALGAAAVAHGAVSAGESLVPTPSCIGGISSSAGSGLDMNIRMWSISRDTSEDPNAGINVHGIPCMATKTLSTIPGYIQCMNASVQSALNDTDKEIINGYLNSGFYYE